LSGDAPALGFRDQALRRTVVKASKERFVVALSMVAYKTMLGRAEPVAFVPFI
jgi:hypothetical protein